MYFIGKMEIHLVLNIFGKFKLSATSSLKRGNEMQYLAITATRNAASRPLWESFSQSVSKLKVISQSGMNKQKNQLTLDSMDQNLTLCSY